MASSQRAPPPVVLSKVISTESLSRQHNNHHHQHTPRRSSASNYADCIITHSAADTGCSAGEVSGGLQYCALAALFCIGSIGLVAVSVRLRITAVDDKIAYTHGLFILAMGFVFFVALTHFWQQLLQRTQAGRAFCGRYWLLRSDALEITNKLVSAIQAITSCVAGFMVCTSSCRRSFLTASHYMSDTYAWFGCAYFVYDMWSMYRVHEQKVSDKRQLQKLQLQRQQQNAGDNVAATEDGLYDKARAAAAAATHSSTLRQRNQSTAKSETAAGQQQQQQQQLELTDVELGVMLKRLKQVSIADHPSFLRYCADNPVMTAHHVFLQSFGLYVIVYLRGSFGDCVYGFVYLMELSTPFVSVRSILSTLQLKETSAYIVNGLAMLVTFFVCRVMMWPSLYYWYGQMVGLNMWQAVSSLPRTCQIGTAILFLPQLYWFYLMMRGALKVFFPAKAAKRPVAPGDGHPQGDARSNITDNKDQ